MLWDETLAAEIMEGQSNDPSLTYLADHPPEDHEEVSAVPSRFWRWRLAPAQASGAKAGFFADLEPCLVGDGSQRKRYHWARVLSGAGHGEADDSAICKVLCEVEQERC